MALFLHYPVVCNICGFHMYVTHVDGKDFAEHPNHPTCTDAGKKWEIQIPLMVVQEIAK